MAAAFPDAALFPPVHRPIGPHPMPMFEAHISPEKSGDVAQWIETFGHGLVALIHAHTGDAYRDHTELAKWVRGPLALNTACLKG